MKLIQLPRGDGQEIYIDPMMCDIKTEWINKKNGSIILPDETTYINPIYSAYKEMFKQFHELGYKVITDSEMVSENTFFFTPCLDKHINNTKEEYETKKKNKINYYLKKEGVEEPFSVNFPIDSFPNNILSLPFVLKNEDSQGGIEKFLIKTPNQLEILKRFYEEINSYAREKTIERVKEQYSYYSDLEFDENGYSKRGICISLINYKEEFHKYMRLQKFIKTPTKYNTSLRVLTSSSGDILCSSLKYSEASANKKDEYYGIFDRYLSDPSSPYFLDSETIISNTVAGGNSILLGKDNYSILEQEILISHNIDPNNADVPIEVMNACCNIAINCKRELGAICGFDFIYDEDEKSWKFLEEHEYPMLYSYAEKYNIEYDSNKKNFEKTNKLLDINIRLYALALTMNKKLNKEKNKTLTKI